MRGLIGKELKHSYSQIIHQMFEPKTYQLFNFTEEEVNIFLERKNFDYVNVTIPYKEKVVSKVDILSPEVKQINALNLVVNKNNKLYGYNTDYLAFNKILLDNEIDCNKNILILGSGGTSKMVQYALKNKAKELYIASRTPHQDNKYISYENLKSIAERIDIIINTTPVGMYPKMDERVIDLDLFTNLSTVIDFIYNPERTNLIIDAEAKGIKAVNGLSILIYQAIYAYQIYKDKNLDNIDYNLYKRIFQKLNEKKNIVLIGMPLSGKSTLAGKLKLVFPEREVIETDKIIENQNGCIDSIFNLFGESYFRKLEIKVCEEISKKENLIISSGGGIILNNINIKRLKHKGIIIFIDKPLEILEESYDYMIKNNDNNRPLLKSKDDLVRLYEMRYDLYKKAADFVVTLNNNIYDNENILCEKIKTIMNIK